MSTLQKPSVSIIMPVFNGADFIEESINSVLAQTWQNWELIVISDASTDGTVDIVQDLSRQDKRIRLIHLEKNVGSGEARNHGMKAALGRYVAFLDSDDLWLPSKLERQMQVMQDTQCALCCTSYGLMDHAGNLFPNKVRRVANKMYDYDDIAANNVIGCLTMVIDREQTGPLVFPKVRSLAEDFAFWLSILKKGLKVQGIPENLATYRLRKDSRSSKKLRAAAATWSVLRHNEKVPFFKALMYFLVYAVSRSPRLFERTRFTPYPQDWGSRELTLLMLFCLAAPMANYLGHGVELGLAALGIMALTLYTLRQYTLRTQIQACFTSPSFRIYGALVVGTLLVWGLSCWVGIRPEKTLHHEFKVAIILGLLTFFGMCAHAVAPKIHRRQFLTLAGIAVLIAAMVVLERFWPSFSMEFRDDTRASRLNFTGLVLIWGLPFTVYQWIRSPSRAWMPLMVMAAIGISNGRIAWVSAPVVLLVYAALTIKEVGVRRWAGFLAGCALALMAGIGGIFLAHGSDYLSERVHDLTTGKGEGRIDLWRFALNQWQAHNPWLGIGVQGFRHLDFSGTSLPSSAHPHNSVVQLLLETGIIGLAAALGTLGALLRKGWKNMAPFPAERNVLFLCFLGVSLGSLASTSLFHVWWVVFMLMPLAWILSWPQNISLRQEP